MNFNLNSRQLVALLVVGGGAFAAYIVAKDAKEPGQMLTQLVGIMLVAGIVAVFLSAAGGTAEDVSSVSDGLRRARRGERPSPPSGASPNLARVFDELSRFGEEEEKRLREARDAQAEIENVTRKLTEGVQVQVIAAEDTARLVKDIAGAMRAFSSNVEIL